MQRDPREQNVDSALAALMADDPIPGAMQGMGSSSAPPRFCGFVGGGDFGGGGKGGSFGAPVQVDPTGPNTGAAPMSGSAGTGSAGPIGSAGGSASSDGGMTPGCGAGDGGIIMGDDGGVSTGGGGSAGFPGMAGSGGFGDFDGGFDGGFGEEPELATCESVPIGFWRFDDCNTERTDLNDSSNQGHTAFRNVALQCVAGQERQAVSFAREGDMVYAPDQPDFGLNEGVTVAAWVNPDKVTGQQTVFRKRDDANSAFALMVNEKKFQFVIKLASGKLVSVSAPATAGQWTHVAGTYDGETLRLYKNGVEVSKTNARGTIANGVGPLLMGNDIKERRLRGRMDNAWFNTLAAPADTIMQLTCLHLPPGLTVSPATSGVVTAGTPVEYTATVTNNNTPSCAPTNFELFIADLPEGFTSDQFFVGVGELGSGEQAATAFNVASSEEADPGPYTVGFGAFTFDNNFEFFDEVQATAEYVVAEPTGCFVRTNRELMIRDLSVVEDPLRTTFDGPANDPRTGAWTFGRLMEQMAPTPADAPDMVEQLFQTWLSDQTINTFSVPARSFMQQLVLDNFPRTANNKLDLKRAPLRLLAIVNRIDKRNLADANAGEGRFVFDILTSDGFQTQFTLIIEYRLPAKTTADVQAWADQWHALQTLPFPSEEYNAALNAITDRFAGRNAEPGRVNGSALGQLRTNEFELQFPWELREFHLSATTGFLQEVPVALTPDTGFINESPVIADFVNQNEASILTETHVVPETFQGSPLLGGSSFNDLIAWRSCGITNNEARHKFSLNTCNGCHSVEETGTVFLQVNPREPGEVARLSGFMTGINVPDPVTGEERHFNDLGRRRADLTQIVCSDAAPAVLPGAAPASNARSATTASAPTGAAKRKAFLSKGISRSH